MAAEFGSGAKYVPCTNSTDLNADAVNSTDLNADAVFDAIFEIANEPLAALESQRSKDDNETQKVA